MQDQKIRLQKMLADCGVASRRKAEELIQQGKVKVNGHVAQIGDKVNPKTDHVTVAGRRIVASRQYYYIMLHKPRGYVSTMSDEMGRKCVAELVKDIPARVYPVGRLDRDSEGLLLMTPFNASATDERTASFVSEYQTRYNEIPNQFAADGYDCIYAIYEACQKAGVTADMSHEDICAALISTFTSSDFSVDGLTGSGMTWAATGEISKAPLVFEVQDGVYVAR